MSMDNEETGHDETFRGGGGGTRTEAEEVPPQRLRIHVPTAASELVLGLSESGHLGIKASTSSEVTRDGLWNSSNTSNTKVSLGVNERGFVGVLGAAHHGNIFLCATGALDVGTEYQHAARVGEIVETAIGAMRTALMLNGMYWSGTGGKMLPAALLVGQTSYTAFNAVMSPLSDGVAGGLSNVDYLKTGNICLFGAKTLKLQSVESVTSTASLFNSHNAGISASMSSVLFASVNAGACASVTGGYSASVKGNSASTVGTFEASLVARDGRARVRGLSVRIGNKRIDGTASKLLSGNVGATNDVWIRAADQIELGVTAAGEPPGTSGGHLTGITVPPTGVQVIKDRVRTSCGETGHAVSNTAVISVTKKSVLKVSDKRLVLGRLVAPMPTKATLQGIRAVYNTANAASEGLMSQLKNALSLGFAAGVVGGIAAGAAIGAAGGAVEGAAADSDGELDAIGNVIETGDMSGEGVKLGVAAGAIRGGVGGWAAVGMIAMKAAGKAQKAAQRAAQKAYAAGLKAAFKAERRLAIPNPVGPKIEIKDSGIELSCGPATKMKITSTGVDIKGIVKINGMNVMM